MAQSHLSNADCLRLAVAVSVLRSKPKDLSVNSYVLHLRTKLPPSGPAPPTADYCWKTYALQLEQDLEQLREKYDAQRTELLAVPASFTDRIPEITSSVTPSVSHKGSDIVPGNNSKKKAKTKKAPGSTDVTAPNQYHPHLDSQSTSQGLQDQIIGNFPRNSQLLHALRAFEKATNDNVDGSTLLYVTLHTVRIVARMLAPSLAPPAANTGNYTLVSTLGQVLHHTIISSLHSTAVLQELDIAEHLELSVVDKIFDRMIDDIFGPVIRAFKRVSMFFLSPLLADTSLSHIAHMVREAEKPLHNPLSVDLRPALLGLFQTLVDGLRLASSPFSNRKGGQDRALSRRRAISLSSLKASLVLEVVRELESILFAESHEVFLGAKGPDDDAGSHGTCINSRVPGSSVPGSGKVQDRVMRLVAKDTLWYLCSLLHILADLPAPQNLKLPSGPIRADSALLTSTHSPEVTSTNEGDGIVLLGLLHETILSALYDLVLKCQPAVSQLQRDNGPPSGANSRHSTQGPQPIDNEHHSLDVVRNNNRNPKGVPDPQPMTSKPKVSKIKPEVSLVDGREEATGGSQAQGQSSVIIAREPEVGDPGGRGELTLRDDNSSSAMTGGVYCHAADEAAEVANQGGRMSEIINTKNGTLSRRQPELGVYSSDMTRSAAECLIDESGFAMLLGVVERYILDPEYASV